MKNILLFIRQSYQKKIEILRAILEEIQDKNSRISLVYSLLDEKNKIQLNEAKLCKIFEFLCWLEKEEKEHKAQKLENRTEQRISLIKKQDISDTELDELLATIY